MRLTTKSRYGTRLIIDLALNAGEAPVRLSDISKRQSISLKYLEKLIRTLKKAGFVKSIRGPYGGYMLAKPMENISVGDIVRVLEGSDAITDCTESKNVCGTCTRAGRCLTQYIWAEASKSMFERLDSFKIDQLIQKSDEIIRGS
jgi:Rrf2 family transcriptional regulator, iron-sulfur cluster assembly transcription factor